MREIESYDAVLILGEDLTQTAPHGIVCSPSCENKAREMAAKHVHQIG